MDRRRPVLLLLAALATAMGGCAPEARRMLTITSPPTILEGQRAHVNITVQNIYDEPIVPVSMTLYVRPEPTEYFVVRHLIADIDYYGPLQATEVRHLGTLNRIEADHVRDRGTWRRVPDSRYLHPRILLPGKSFSETFQFQAYEPYRRLLYCDFYYLPLGDEPTRRRLYVRSGPQTVAPDAERYTEVFNLVDTTAIQDPDPQPEDYLLFRPRGLATMPSRLLTRRVPLRVTPRQFSYLQAARRARFGARTHCYFSAAGTWVFEYPDAGTWFIGPVATTKLSGQYVNLIADLELRQASELALTAPRNADDKFLELLQKLGHSDPKATGDTAAASIPAESLLTVLQQAESLGYTIDARTWRPLR